MGARAAVVTGGASGLGRRTVQRLLAEGWQVWSFDVSAQALAQQAEQDTGVRTVTCNVTDLDSVVAAFNAVRRDASQIDALVCSAGVFRTGTLESHTPADVDALLAVNIKGAWLTVVTALPLLRAGATTSAPSRVVLMGSISGIRPKAGSGMYGATKAALHVMAGVFAVELAPSGVVVNVIAPGPVDTPMHHAAMQRTGDSNYTDSGLAPLGRIASMDDIADAVLMLLGPSAKFINGVVLPVDGGTRAAFYRDLPGATSGR